MNNVETKYHTIAEKILSAALDDSLSYERLSYFCDTFGPRLSGSDNLKKALEWVDQQMKLDGLDNVQKEDVYVPHWVRGNEYARIVSPSQQKLSMLGLGGSIATPNDGITAPVLVVRSYKELEERSQEAIGKIVLFNYNWTGYGDGANFRVRGAIQAARYGAVASLIRSVTPIISHVPHTGVMFYDDTIRKIPHAAISSADAEMIERIQKRGQDPVVHLYMEAKTLPDALSANVMCELKGCERPQEIIALGGHSDSWDTGTGAHDDASGCFAAWEAIKLLKSLGIQPKKTLRTVFWVNEENGTRGGKAYAEKHKDEKHALMFEFDSGCFPPSELGYTGPDSMFNKFKQFESLFNKIGNIEIKKGGGGVDIGPMMSLGVPGMSLNTDDKEHYFWYHHAPTDTIDTIKPEDYKKCIATIALAMYLYAELP